MNLTRIASRRFPERLCHSEGNVRQGFCVFLGLKKNLATSFPSFGRKVPELFAFLSNLDQYSRTDAAMASLGVSFIDTRLQHLKDTK